MGRVVSQAELILAVADAKRNAHPVSRVAGPLKIVFTNGVFDLLHPGHIRCLEEARSLGDLLIVAINSDASTRRLKGDARPILPQHERAEILAALACVDFVTIFDEETPQQLIARVLPDVLVKGGDWASGEIVGRHEVEAAGGKVLSLPFEQPWSTTDLISRITGKPSH